MDTKFIIFMAISVILVTAIYSSSVSVVFAAWACINTKDQGLIVCTDSKAKTFTFCTKDKNGEWKCEKAMESTDKIPSNLQDAIDVATQESQNTTKAPNTDLLLDGDFPPLTSDDNEKEPKTPKVPEGLGGLKDEDKSPTINPDLP